MPRPRGVRNADFEDKRNALLDRLTDHALNTDLERASLRQFAQAAEVTEPTLRHYFTDRRGVVAAVMARIAERGSPFIALAAEPDADFDTSVKTYVDLCIAGALHAGFARAHAFGIIEGSADPELAKAYTDTLLEPSLQAVESRMKPFVDPDGKDPAQLRAIALALFGPMLVGVLHQRVLGGDEGRPLDMPDFFERLRDAVSKGFDPKADDEA